jgi:hypothetical protein
MEPRERRCEASKSRFRCNYIIASMPEKVCAFLWAEGGDHGTNSVPESLIGRRLRKGALSLAKAISIGSGSAEYCGVRPR